MLLYRDVISGDEMFSDAFPIKEVDDIAFEVDCKMITVKEGDVDIVRLLIFWLINRAPILLQRAAKTKVPTMLPRPSTTSSTRSACKKLRLTKRAT